MFKKIMKNLLVLAALAIIIYLGVYVRLSTINTPTVLDYDPWWFYRHAKEIIENNFKPLKWDLLSFYPPGRPLEPYQGWSYTIAFFYEIFKLFAKNITLEKVAIISPLIIVALIPIPAFLLGRELAGDIAGLATALFAVLSPTFIGVSMAGYCDSDAPVVFYSFLSTLFVIYALKRRSLIFCILAIIANLLFVYNWGGGWITLILFFVFFPTLPIFRIIENMIHSRKISINLNALTKELKALALPLAIIFTGTNIVGYILWNFTMFQSLIGALAFTGVMGQPLLVNISVAELQPINIFSREGFLAVAGRVGLLPVIMTFVGLPFLVLYKLFKKEKISFEEIFLFLWALVMFYFITRGVRFALLFSIAASISAGYVIGNLYNYLKDQNPLLFSTVFGAISLLVLFFVSNAIQLGLGSTGMLISQNWYDMLDWLKTHADKDSLIVTWWDPGHIIAGYTGLKVHADGAHCAPGACIPYDHNIRIQDMGFVFSTSNEEKAIETLEKYMELTPEQCQKARDKFDGIMPKDACKPVSEMYLIASSDLIGKYHWLSYFGQQGNARDFIQLTFSGYQNGLPTYGNGMVTLLQKNNQIVGVLNLPQQGIRNAVIKEIVYFEQGERKHLNYTNVTNSIDGLLWVDPSYYYVIYMLPEVRDSLFARLFFWNGEGLKHFKLVYSNPEIRLYKVIFD